MSPELREFVAGHLAAACPPEAQGGKHKGGAVGSTMGFSYAAQVVEVTVDEDTGHITVDKVWAALDCGRGKLDLLTDGREVTGELLVGDLRALGQVLHAVRNHAEAFAMLASLRNSADPRVSA